MRRRIFLAEWNDMELIAVDIGNVLYGLKTSGARVHEKFAETMYQLGCMPSKADFNFWMKDCKDHWKYVCMWVED
eukprot:13815298-Ditylum_brightwellii.AAC.1